MFDPFFIFPAFVLRIESRGKVFDELLTETHKIAADKVNITECDRGSPSVTIQFFSKL